MNNNKKLIEAVYDDVFRSILISCGEGYEPIIECRDILTEKMGFILENEYGITDMTQEFIYKNKQYFLKYDSENDLIVFDTKINEEEELKIFRQIATALINERGKKIIDDKTKK